MVSRGLSRNAGSYCRTCATCTYIPILRGGLRGGKVFHLFGRVRVPLMFALCSVRRTNIGVRNRRLGHCNRRLKTEVIRLRGRVCRVTKRRFGVGSPGRLNIVLFRGLRVPRTGGAGAKCSATTSILSGLTPRCPVMTGVLRCHRLTGLGSACTSKLTGCVKVSKEVRDGFGRAVATAKHVDDARPGLRGVPIHVRLKHLVHGMFMPGRNYIFMSTSCSRVRLHVLTRYSNSRRLVRTCHRTHSVRQVATSRMFRMPFSRIASLREEGTGTIGFNVICKVDSFKLDRSLDVSEGRTTRCVRRCFRSCPKVGAFLSGYIDSTGRGKCTRALCKEEEPVPRLGSDGFVREDFKRHITVGTPVRKATTSVVGVTVVRMGRRLGGEGLGSQVVLRIRSRLLVRTSRERLRRMRRVLRSGVRRTTRLLIPLDISVRAKGG